MTRSVQLALLAVAALASACRDVLGLGEGSYTYAGEPAGAGSTVPGTGSPVERTFGRVRVGTSLELSIPLRPSNMRDVATVQMTGDSAFSLLEAACTTGGGSECTAKVRFSPRTAGTRAAALHSRDGEALATLTGTGTAVLSIKLDGDGRGIIEDEAGTLRCESSCSFEVDTDTVILKGTDDGDSFMTSWSQSSCPARQPCPVTMTGDQSLTARFKAPWVRSGEGPENERVLAIRPNASEYQLLGSSGESVWSRTISFEGNEGSRVLEFPLGPRSYAVAAALHAAGRWVILADGGSSSQTTVTAVRSDGTRAWGNLIAASREHFSFGVRIGFDREDGIVAVARVGTPSDGVQTWLRRYDSSGKVLWTTTLPEGASDVAVDRAGYIYVLSHAALVKLTREGAVVWSMPRSRSVRAAACERGVVVTGGLSQPGPRSPEQSYLTRLDETGTELWSREVDGGELGTYGTALHCDDDGRTVLAARELLATGESRLLLTAFEKDGTRTWTRRYHSAPNAQDEPSEVFLHASGVIVGGHSRQRSGAQTRWWVKRYPLAD